MGEQLDIIHRLIMSYREVNQALSQMMFKSAQLVDTEVTPIQLIVLRALSETPHIGLNELADSVCLGASAASGIVDRMVKAGLVVRERTETDRRSISLSLSEKGDMLWQQMDESRIKFLAPLASLEESERMELLRKNRRIVEILQRVREEIDNESNRFID